MLPRRSLPGYMTRTCGVSTNVAQCRLAQPYLGRRLRDTPLGREGIEDEEKVQIERFELH
jgi:hypothetical protein